MGSMNWLGFSLSPQELPSHHEATNEDHISGGVGDCFDLSATDSTAAPPLHHHHHLHPSFGLLEATFHRSTHNHSEDWNMKGNSEISMLMGSQEVDHQPKLENFLGSTHCFRENSNHGDNNNYMFSTTTTTTSQDNTNNNNSIINPNSIVASNNNNNNNNGLNVSMIKTWLRSNHPSSSSASASQSDELIMAKNGPSGPALMTSPQTLSLSMGTGGTHSVVGPALPLLAVSGGGGSGGCGEREGSLSESSGGGKQQSDNTCTGVGVCNSSSTSNTLDVQSGAIEAVPRKSIDTFGQRTSIYRGVTRHRWTGRYEAHLWDNSCRREGQTRKGRQVYLGGYDKEEKAARAYDLAAIKYWGTTTTTNFPISDYEKEIEEMKHMTRQEYVASLRRKSSGFSRGASIYRGVTRHHQHGRWQARIGRVAGNKDLYLGTFSTQEEAAEAYDIAAIKFRGLNAVTNFEISRYDVKAILDSTTLPIGGAAKRLKEVEDLTTPDSRQIIRATTATVTAVSMEHDNTSQLTHDHGIPIPNFHSWPGIAFPQAQPLTMYHPYGAQQQQRIWCKQEQDADHGSNSFHDHLQHQLQLNSGTHNFFQMHNLMGLENSSLEHSSGSNSIVYGNGNGGTDGGYNLPFTTSTHDGNGNHENNGYENYYYLSQSHNHHEANNNGGLRGTVGTYDQGSACNNWVPTAIPTLIPRSNNMAAVGGGHSGGVGGVPTFTVWNDT